jgi:hypothetical protein
MKTMTHYVHTDPDEMHLRVPYSPAGAKDFVPYPASRYATVPHREIPYTCSGDYIGSLVEASNRAAILEDWAATNGEDDAIDCEPPYVLSGNYSIETLAWPAWCPLTRNLAEIIERLESYPLIDEERHSEMEWEAGAEAWSDWAQGDVERDLITATEDLGSEVLHDAIADMTPEDWWDVVALAEDGGNPLWHSEGIGATWSTEEMATRLADMIKGEEPKYVTGAPLELLTRLRDAARRSQ